MEHSIETPVPRRQTGGARGDGDDAYREIFATHRIAVFRFAVLLVGNTHVAEDITAEVFARVLPRWRAGAVHDPLQYLRRCVVNEVRSRHRRRGGEQRVLARLASRRDLASDNDRLQLAEHRSRAGTTPAGLRSPSAVGCGGRWPDRPGYREGDDLCDPRQRTWVSSSRSIRVRSTLCGWTSRAG